MFYVNMFYDLCHPLFDPLLTAIIGQMPYL